MKKKSGRGKSTLDEAIERRLRAMTNGHAAKPEVGEAAPATGNGEGSAPGARRTKLWLFLLVCLVGSSLASFVIFKYIAPSVPNELVGTWMIADGPLKGATLEFRWYGTAIATLNVKGKKEETRQAVKVAGSKMLLTSTDDATGKEDTVSQTILKLTKDELVIRDEERRVYTMKRVGD